MATAKISKKDMAQDDFIEGVFDFGEWLEAHWQRVAIGIGAAIAVVLLGLGWNTIRENASQDANRLLAQGIDAFSPQAPQGGAAAPAPRYAEALGFFEQAATRGGSGGVGDAARLFQGRTLTAMNRAAEAAPILEKLSGSGNESMAAAAKIALAEAVEATGNPERAATLLQEVASKTTAAPYPPDSVLMLLAGVRERQGKTDEAKRVYDDLATRFPQSSLAADAKARSAELGKAH